MKPSLLFQLFRPPFHRVTRLSSRVTHANSFALRSHTCGELRKSDVGRKVKLSGWVQFQRMNKFVLLRDAYGVTQLVVPDEKLDVLDKIRSTPLESVISANGKVATRPPGQDNPNQLTGDIEVILDDVEVLSSSISNLPFTVQESPKVKEALRLEHRYLQLRHESLQRNIRLRSEIVMKMREFLVRHHGFVDIETPTLFRRTPGGAQEFVVPTRTSGKFYSLVQSPQQFKQLLMIGGFDRYFQIARCYRDEGTKPNRQPEFTQVDIEMSFTTKENIQRLIEGLLNHVWPEDMGRIPIPFPEMTYKDAMKNYGVDKPDTRFDVLLQDVTELAKASEISRIFGTSEIVDFAAIALVFKDSAALISKSAEQSFLESAKMTTGKTNLSFVLNRIQDGNKWKSSLAKKLTQETMNSIGDRLGASAGDVVLLGLGPRESLVPSMGKMRLEVANHLETLGVKLRSNSKNFLWVVDFPLFLPSEELDGGPLQSAHHPFTAPHPEDEQLLRSSPLDVRGLHYDLVLNGSEIGGGSIRIHQSDVQELVLKEIIQEDPANLHHLLKALSCGAPPHGGIALGLDRLMSIICDTKSIRDVIAFPKSLDGKDLMSGAPSSISEKEKKMYHIGAVHNK
ncbi:aspartate--tRNA ligase, mitochondrial-like [Daphnia pulex]|uniref:aspartate--tRNA ligase, mitochondrial-like n=1 Tax=Daphnia pulex TaxID=6669 RepID=UPI001EDDE7F2|nr:aspartate--tRNA ligase, mitochondrial-like [Daphnia pulex]